MELQLQNTTGIANYQRIAEAIEYISTNFKQQPDLDEIAARIHLSPFHFQRLFSEWAGVSPKKFLQYLTVEYAKGLLLADGLSLADTAFESGLSGTGRLHDLFVTIEGMTPGEYKNGGESLSVNYAFAGSPFGPLLVASTGKGVCYMAFTDDRKTGLQELQALFPRATVLPRSDAFQADALQLFTHDWSNITSVKLHLHGTPFQLKVWETLLHIPMGQLTTYGQVAGTLGNPGASRAVGTAIGDNPVAFLIPCHRVIRSSGITGQYHWGKTRKMAMIGWEAAKKNNLPSMHNVEG